MTRAGAGGVIAADAFLGGLRGLGIELVSSVPCSYFAGPLQLLADDPTFVHVPAANEGSALAIAAGARLAGRPAAVLAQNSGFGNLINPLTSLLLPYRIPVLLVLSMRGWPAADAGEPQHLWMGRVVPGWLDDLGVRYRWLAPGGQPLPEVLVELGTELDGGRVGVLLVAKGAIGDALGGSRPAPGPVLSRDDVVTALLAVADAHVVSTTGNLSRSLFNRGDRPQHFYMQGSMGHAAGFAFGVAHACPQERVVVLDGDGAVLMHAGTLSTIGHFGPPNLTHVVFDNGSYESTGGQPTAATGTDLAGMALASGYRHARRVRTVAELRAALDFARSVAGPTAVVVAGGTGGPAGDRASSSVDVPRLARRFARSLGTDLPEPAR